MRSTQKKIADALQPRRRILPWLSLNEVTSDVKRFYAPVPLDNIYHALPGIHGRIFGIETNRADSSGRRRGDVQYPFLGYLRLHGLGLSVLVQDDEFADCRNRSNARVHGNWQATQ